MDQQMTPHADKPQLRQRTNRKDGSELLFIPGGEFTMGSDEYSDERPPHRVHVDSFWMGRCEITNRMYRRFRAETNHRPPDFTNDTLYNNDDQPIIGVDYSDATAYCRWAGGRLPTEAEWEYAARGTEGRIYPWGNEPPDADRAVHGLIFGRGGKAAPVGTTAGDMSPFGVMDMAGNVREWCSDWAAPYKSESGKVVRNPTGAAQGNRRIMRGGCWLFQAPGLRSTMRYLTAPHQKVSFGGFRLVVDAAASDVAT